MRRVRNGNTRWTRFCHARYSLLTTSRTERRLLAFDELDGQGLPGRLPRHEQNEPVVEILGGVVAHLFQRLGEGGHLHETRHVAARPDEEFDVRHLEAEH